MQDDKARERAAMFLLGEVIDSLLDTPAFGFSEALQSGALQLEADAEGWAVLVCNGEGKEGQGDLSFVYRPRGFVTKLYAEVEKRFDELEAKCRYSSSGGVKSVLLRDNVTTEFREETIREAVYTGVLTALAPLMLTVGRALTGQYHDSLVIAAAGLEMISASAFEGQTYEENGGETTVLEIERHTNALIEARVNEVSKEKRKHLTALLSNLPALRLRTGRAGRPLGVKNKKTAEELKRENAERRGLIISAMCALYRKEATETNMLLAEDSIKKITTAREMNISRGTLDAWLEAGGYDFDELKEEAIEMCARN